MTPLPPPGRLGPLLAALCLVFLSGCSGNADLERAGVHLANHRLEAAEALLAGRSGELAQKLQEELRQAQELRAERMAEVEEIAASPALDEARLALREIARRDPDPLVREHAGRFLGGLANRIAEQGIAGLSYSPFPRRVAGEPAGAGEPRSISPPPTRAGTAEGPARSEPAGLRPQSARDERARDASPPPERDPPRRAPAREDPPPVANPAVETVAATAAPTPARAVELERAGRLQEARSAWIDIAFEAAPGPERAACVARARALERRLILRAELGAAIATSPERFAAEGIRGGDERSLHLDGETRDWSEVEEALMRRLAARATLSREARLGLVLERLACGAAGEGNAALAELERLRQRGEIEEGEVFMILADHRGEALPEGGYVFHGGLWVTRADHEQALRAARIQELAGVLARAQGPARDEALAGLVELGEGARAALVQSLEERLARATQSLTRGNTLNALERLAERRRELDRRRETALALIFDQVIYFYPYSGPDLPEGKRQADYWPVQRRVDELVVEVQEVWNEGAGVRLPPAFAEGLTDLAWSLEVARDLELSLAAPSTLPAWVAGLPALPQVELSTFAWDRAERERLAYDRAVLALNQRRWATWSKRSDERAPREDERRQVSITNEYRRMLGRRALVWNPDVQLAARWHSEYMADTGDFGHYQSDPERRTPFDRMRLAGYDQGASENCHRGSGSAEGAHLGWRGSSGHHRNILMATHREMASAQVSGYWTQNFGSGTGFLGELEGWQD